MFSFQLTSHCQLQVYCLVFNSKVLSMLLLSFLVQVLHFQNCYVLFPGSKSLTQRKGCGQRSVSHPLIDNYATSDVAMLVREARGGGGREGGREGRREVGGWAGGCVEKQR